MKTTYPNQLDYAEAIHSPSAHSEPSLGDWSSGMIPALGAGGREFDSRITPPFANGSCMYVSINICACVGVDFCLCDRAHLSACVCWVGGRGLGARCVIIACTKVCHDVRVV